MAPREVLLVPETPVPWPGVPVGWLARCAGGMGDSRLEPLVLSDAERRTLENRAKRRKTAQGLALRARIGLACAEGRSNTAVAAPPRVRRDTARRGGPVPGPAGGRGWAWSPPPGCPEGSRRPGGGGG